MYCSMCGAENLDEAKFCKKCGKHIGEHVPERKTIVATEDELPGYWYAIIWGSLIIPIISQWIIIIVSSIMYYSWKNKYPRKANRINLHGWLAFITIHVIVGFIWLISRLRIQ